MIHLEFRPAWLVAFGVAAALGHACRTPPIPDAESTSNLAPVPPAAEASVSEEPIAPVPVAQPQGNEARLETVFELAAHLSLLHFRSGGLLVDFGTPSRHKHTLGDWRSGWHGDYDKGGVTYSYGTGNGSSVLFDTLPGEAGASLRIVARARAEGGRKLRLYVDGQGIGALDLAQEDFGYAEVRLPEGLTAGQHTLLLRGNGRKPTSDGTSAAFAVDYIRFEYNEAVEPNVASTQSDIARAGLGKDEPGLALGSAESVTVHIIPPPGAVLSTVARSSDEQQARLTVSARADGESVVQLGSWNLGPVEQRLTVPLDRLSGRPVELTIQADGGGIVLPGAAVKVPMAQQDRPSGKAAAQNLIILLIDTLRADKVAAYAPGTRVKTDALGVLAGESMLFERATAAENWTKPSVASVLSGLYPETHGAKGDKDKLPSSVVILPEHLRGLGFDTAGFVANGYVSGKFGFEQGWGKWTNYVREGKRNRAESVFNEAAAWLATRPSDKPFFLYVHTIDPHVPYFPPKRYLEMYDAQPYSGPIEAAKTADQLGHIKGKGLKVNDRDKQRLEALYDGEVTYHDDQFARFMAKLEELGLLENTAIIVTSDHGEEFFEHDSVGHGHSLYEELLHVPFIVRLPGAVKGQGARSLIETTNVDIVPTACELLGAEPPAGVEGRSLVPILRGERLPGAPRASYSEFLAGQRSVRAGAYKAIFKGPRAALFNLDKDPKETADVAAEYPIAMALLRDLLGSHLGEQIDLTTGSKRRRHQQEKTKIDEATKQQLKALGYMQD